MACELCGRTELTRSATLYQNIGMIVMFRYRTLKGTFCLSCITHYFWEYTLITFALGWWGIISFFLTPLILLNNLFFFLRAQLGDRPPATSALLFMPNPVLEACPRCQSMQSASVGLSRSVWASLVVSGLLLVWAGYLSLAMLQNRTQSDNWIVVGLFVGVNLFVGLCLVMLIRSPLRRCQQCQWSWPARTS